MRLSRSPRRGRGPGGHRRRRCVGVAACVPARAAIGPSADPGALRVTATTTVFADIVQSVGGSADERPVDRARRRRAGGLRATPGRRAAARRRAADRLERRRPRRLPRSADRGRPGGDDARGSCSATGSRRSTSTASRTRTSGSTRRSSRERLRCRSIVGGAERRSTRRTRADYEANARGLRDGARRARRGARRPRSRRSRPPTASSSPSTTPSRTSPAISASSSSGVVLANVGQEPTAAELAALVEKVKAAGVKAVFSEAQFNPKLAQTLAAGGGHQAGRHDPLQRRPRAGPGGHLSGHDALEHASRSSEALR